MTVACQSRSSKACGAVIARRVSHGCVAQHGRTRGSHKARVGRGSGKVVFQRIAQLQRLHSGLVGLAFFIHKRARGHADLGHPDILRHLRAFAFILYQPQGLSNGRAQAAVARVQTDLDAAHALDVAFEQKARPHRTGKQPGFHPVGRFRPLSELPAIGKQQHAHGRVLRLRGGNVQAHQRICIVGAHRNRNLAQGHIAQQPVGIAHVGENVIALAVRHNIGRWTAAALWHVGHHNAFEQHHVAGLNGHLLLHG